MPWYSKETPTRFDTAQIPGLQFLHGDALARQFKQIWIAGKKYPLISFPSGVTRELMPTQTDGTGAVQIFDGLEIYFHSNRNDAYYNMLQFTKEHGYSVSLNGSNQLNIRNPYSDRSYELTFDEQVGTLANIVLSPDYAMELLGGESRALLPPLYTNEKIGLDAIASLKFFTPDGNWTWYPTEFDGDDLFFGLVSGFEVELGYFSLTELEEVRGGLGLPIERDLWFEPTTLKDLIALHERRG